MLKQKTFNYITLILAIITIFMAISIVENNASKWPCVIMLLITLLFSYISRKYNDEVINISKKDKEALEQIEYVMKNGRVKKISKDSINEKENKK